MGGIFDFDNKAIGPTFEKKKVFAASTRPRKVLNKNMVTSSYGGRSSSHNTQRYNPYTENLADELLFQSWLPQDEPSLNALFRNIHKYDAIAGSAIDLISTLPYSDFNLTGIEDTEILKIYETSVENIDIENIMPDLTVEFLTIGKVIYSLLFDQTNGVWSDMIPQDIDLCDLLPIPVHGFDPKIDLRVDPEFRRFLSSPDPRDRDAIDKIPEQLKSKMIAGGIVPLEPLNTLFVGRKTNPLDIGTSFLARTLPFYAIEKALIDGTLIESRRRQRAILHITAGIEDLWEPTPEEMDSIAALFMQADEDPQGAIVVTRTGVESQEIRAGGDFWKFGDEWGFLADGKMRAMGINESFLSGDAVYSTLEIALSVFVEMIRTLRDKLTARVFYRNIFQTLARVHGFVKRTPADLSHRIRIDRSVPPSDKSKNFRYPSSDSVTQIQPGELLIPKVQWSKQLRPEADENYLDVLETMKEVGIPIPLRTWAAAGGLNIDQVLDMMEEDTELRKEIASYKGSSDEDEGGAWGSVNDILWNKEGNFLALNKRDLKKVLKDIKSNRNRDPLEVTSKVLKGNQDKLEAAEYLLNRMGVCDIKSDDKTIKKVTSHINNVAEENKGDKKINRRVNWEYRSISKMRGKDKEKKVREIPTVMDRLPNTSSKLYSGVD